MVGLPVKMDNECRPKVWVANNLALIVYILFVFYMYFILSIKRFP